MEIRITLHGGPLEGHAAFTDGLDDLKVFFAPGQRRVDAYLRENEVEYHFDKALSRKMTESYDATWDFLSNEALSSIRFESLTGGE